MSRAYVILHHDGIAHPHFDLMLQLPGGMLATWRIDQWPIARETHLFRIANHRADYLTYEGAVSGERGSVRRVEAGKYDLMPDELESATRMELMLRRSHGARADAAKGKLDGAIHAPLAFILRCDANRSPESWWIEPAIVLD